MGYQLAGLVDRVFFVIIRKLGGRYVNWCVLCWKRRRTGTQLTSRILHPLAASKSWILGAMRLYHRGVIW